MKAEIINLAPVTINARDFKDARLAEATSRISEIYQNAAAYADEKNREIARVLATVSSEKSYIEDGFKSVAEYANKTFGIARQNAYALATAGKVYNDEDAPEELKAFSPYKLAEVSSVSGEKLVEAIKSGEISPKTTEKELREYARNAEVRSRKKFKEVEVLDRYTARPCMTAVPEIIASEISNPRVIEDWDRFFCDKLAGLTSSDVDTVEVVKLSKGYATIDAKKPTIIRKLYFNRSFSIVVEFFKSTKKSKKTGEVPKYTVEQLQAMLYAAMESEKEGQFNGEEYNWDEDSN